MRGSRELLFLGPGSRAGSVENAFCPPGDVLLKSLLAPRFPTYAKASVNRRGNDKKTNNKSTVSRVLEEHEQVMMT